MRKYSGTHFLSENKDFNNGNSLRITEKEDISSCYFTIEETKLFWSRLTIFTGLQCFCLEAAFRNPIQFLGMF